MVLTTPPDKSHKHESWHTFIRGGCLYCGWHCDDCPIGVATCKCIVSKEQLADERLKAENLGITSYWRE